MKIPKTVKVGAHTYKVEYPFGFENSTYLGFHKGYEKVIRLAAESDGRPLAETEILSVFIHELIHAVNYNSDDFIIPKGEHGETRVEMLAQGLAALLVDNGWWKPEVDGIRFTVGAPALKGVVESIETIKEKK